MKPERPTPKTGYAIVNRQGGYVGTRRWERNPENKDEFRLIEHGFIEVYVNRKVAQFHIMPKNGERIVKVRVEKVSE